MLVERCRPPGRQREDSHHRKASTPTRSPTRPPSLHPRLGRAVKGIHHGDRVGQLAKAYLLEELPNGVRAQGAALAVVVTTARLRLCELDDKGELQLTETDQLEVLCEAPDGQRRIVIVMNEGRVAELGAELFGSNS